MDGIVPDNLTQPQRRRSTGTRGVWRSEGMVRVQPPRCWRRRVGDFGAAGNLADQPRDRNSERFLRSSPEAFREQLSDPWSCSRISAITEGPQERAGAAQSRCLPAVYGAPRLRGYETFAPLAVKPTPVALHGAACRRARETRPRSTRSGSTTTAGCAASPPRCAKWQWRPARSTCPRRPPADLGVELQAGTCAFSRRPAPGPPRCAVTGVDLLRCRWNHPDRHRRQRMPGLLGRRSGGAAPCGAVC